MIIIYDHGNLCYTNNNSIYLECHSYRTLLLNNSFFDSTFKKKIICWLDKKKK